MLTQFPLGHTFGVASTVVDWHLEPWQSPPFPAAIAAQLLPVRHLAGDLSFVDRQFDEPHSSTASIAAEAQFAPAAHATKSGCPVIQALPIGSAATRASVTARTSVRLATMIPNLDRRPIVTPALIWRQNTALRATPS
jgi:hypothetical protein